MHSGRRSFLRQALSVPAVLTTSRHTSAAQNTAANSAVGDQSAARHAVGYKRIATEEAWAPAELVDRYRKMVATKSIDDPGFITLWSKISTRKQIVDRLVDVGEQRIRDMEASGIDIQVLSLTAPGVQDFDAPTATALASLTNDQLADAIRKHPDRFSGLAAVAPQDPKAASKEMERAVRKLGLKGVIINSHTRGEYLDDPKFWDIFEAAEALNVPIYLHPQAPSPAMAAPYVQRDVEGAILGFAAETGFHALAIIRSGAFDRFPNLRIVLGHAGEALPFWLYRLDYMNERGVSHVRTGATRLAKRPSDYMRENIYVTTSGMPWAPVITFLQAVLGVDRVLYAMDYPYEFELDEVTATDQVPMSDANRRKLFQTNAERVFSL